MNRIDSLMLFASFDISNATSFKYRHDEWPDLYHKIICLLEQKLSKDNGWTFWKANGDELLFNRAVDKRVTVERQVKLVDHIMANEIANLHKKVKLQNIQQLSIKAAVWIAAIRQYETGSKDTGNGMDFRIDCGGKTDFFGKEMDIGFRISKHVPRSKTALSAALVYYLIKGRSRIVKKLRIIGHKSMKGVLHEKRYPIIWLFRARSPRRIEKSFHYDEKYENDLISEFVDKIKSDGNHGKIDSIEYENMLEYMGLKEDYEKHILDFKAS